MKKVFETPAFEVVNFDVEDLIVTSDEWIPDEGNGNDNLAENQTPWG